MNPLRRLLVVLATVLVGLLGCALLTPPAGATVWDDQATGDVSGDVYRAEYDVTHVRVSHEYLGGRQFARVRIDFRGAIARSTIGKLYWHDAGGDRYEMYWGPTTNGAILRYTGYRHQASCYCQQYALPGNHYLTALVPWYMMNMDKTGGPAQISALVAGSSRKTSSGFLDRDWTRSFGTVY